MTDSTFNKKMRNALSGGAAVVSKTQMNELLFLVKVQFRIRKRNERMGFGKLLFSQIRFIGMRIWGLEIVMAILGGFVLRELFMDSYFFTPRKIAFFFFFSTVGASMLLLPFIYRSFRFGMVEIEGAAYFSIRRILICRFLLFFGGEIVIAAIVWIIGCGGQFVNGYMLVYVLLPLLLTGDGALLFLKNASPEKLHFSYLGYAGTLLALFSVSYYVAPWLFDGRFLTLFVCTGAILSVCFIYQCSRMVKCPEETLFM